MALFSTFFPNAGNTITGNSGDQYPSQFDFVITATTGAVRIHTLTGDTTGLTSTDGAGLPGSFVGATMTFFAMDSVAGTLNAYAGIITANTGLGGAGSTFTVRIPNSSNFETVGGVAQQSKASFSVDADNVIQGDSNIAGDSIIAGDSTILGNFNSTGAVTTISSATTDIDGTTISLNGGTINLGNDATTVQETINIATGDGALATQNYVLNLGTGQFADTNLGGTDSRVIVAGTSLTVDSTSVTAIGLFDTVGGDTAGKVESWAQANSTDRIPADRLPDIAIGEVHTITLTDAETTDALGVPSEADIADDLVRDEFVFPGDEGNQINAGDVIIATGTTDGGTEGNGGTVTALYINQTGKATGAGSTIVAGDFRIISSSATTGIQSLVGGAGITTATNVITADVLTGVTGNMQLLGAGTAAQIALADNVDVQGTLDVTGNATFDNIVSIPLAAAGETFIVGNGTANGAISIGTGGARTITVGNGTTVAANITAATVDLTASVLGAFNVTDAGNLSVSSNDGNAIFGATGTGEFQARGAGITAGTDAAPNIIGVGTDGRLQTANISVDSRLAFQNTADANDTLTSFQRVVLFDGTPLTNSRTFAVAAGTVAGEMFKVVNITPQSGTFTRTINFTGQNIMGTTDSSLILDDATASFEMYYTGPAGVGEGLNQWLIIGAN